jgi:radical SAM-linked protein
VGRLIVQQPQQVAPPSAEGVAPTKVRLRFRKGGDLRLLSHHDLMRCFERMLRRAGLPFRTTSGFNPKPRLVFASALPLGIVGSDEAVEIEFDAELLAEEVRDRLARQAPAGLEILDARTIDRRRTAQVRLASYCLALPPERAEGLSDRLDELLRASELWVERTRPESRRLDVRPYVADLRLADGRLEMDLRVTPNGAARPDDLLSLLGLQDLLEAGAVLERTRLELHDEASVAPPAGGER